MREALRQAMSSNRKQPPALGNTQIPVDQHPVPLPAGLTPHGERRALKDASGPVGREKGPPHLWGFVSVACFLLP